MLHHGYLMTVHFWTFRANKSPRNLGNKTAAWTGHVWICLAMIAITRHSWLHGVSLIDWFLRTHSEHSPWCFAYCSIISENSMVFRLFNHDFWELFNRCEKSSHRGRRTRRSRSVAYEAFAGCTRSISVVRPAGLFHQLQQRLGRWTLANDGVWWLCSWCLIRVDIEERWCMKLDDG